MSDLKRRRPLRMTLERLELRMLLHGGSDAHGAEDHHHDGEHVSEAVAREEVGAQAGQTAEHGESHDHDAAGEHSHTLEGIVDRLDADHDGHITQEQYRSLSEAEQQILDPHQVRGADEPVDFDKVLGIPTGASASEAVTYPDFFPKLSGGITIDQTSQPGRTLVRFGTQVNNQGSGPGILISGRPGIDPIPTGAPITSWVNPDGSQNVLQAVYNFNGSSFSLSHYLAAGRFTYHQGHGHFHYDGYAYYRLRSNVGGQPGAYVERADGTGVVGEKVGFCLINISSSFTTESGQSSTTLPGYNDPGQPSTGCNLIQGVHVGYADVYSSSLTGQWIDVTGVPNGSYFLEIELDGENAVTETNDSNNTKTFGFNLNVNPPAGGIQPDEFDTGGNNDSFATATDMGVMGTDIKTGLTIHWGQDHDYFKFVASTTGSYTVTASQADGNIDLYLYDDQEVLIGSSTKPSGNETISYNFTAGESYYLLASAYNSTTSSNYQVGWNLKPQVDTAALTHTIYENGSPGTFTIARNGPTTTPLTINFTLGGSAQNGIDYEPVGTSVTLGDLQSSATITIVPKTDRTVETMETVTLTISPNSGYVVGNGSSVIILRDPQRTEDVGNSGSPGGAPGSSGGPGGQPGIQGTGASGAPIDARVDMFELVSPALDSKGADPTALVHQRRAAVLAPPQPRAASDAARWRATRPTPREEAIDALFDEAGRTLPARATLRGQSPALKALTPGLAEHRVAVGQAIA